MLVYGWLDERCEGAHTNELEVTAAIYALQSFVEHARAQHVQLISESLVTVDVVANLTSRSPRLLRKLRTLHALCERQGITLSTRHLPSVLNAWADRLSRRRDKPHWDLTPTAFRLVNAMCKGRQLLAQDGFNLPEYASPGVPTLCLPRPSLVGVWVRWMRLRSGVLLFPDWRAQPWYREALRFGAESRTLSESVTPPWPSVALIFGKMQAKAAGVGSPAPGLVRTERSAC